MQNINPEIHLKRIIKWLGLSIKKEINLKKIKKENKQNKTKFKKYIKELA